MGTLLSIGVAVIGTGMVGFAFRQGRAKGGAAALQMAAFGLLLVGSSLTGLVRFMTTLTLNPAAWIGIGLLSLAGVLFMVGQKIEGPSGKKKTKQVEESGSTKAVEPAPKRGGKAAAKGDDDFDEIEAILRRHGID